MEIRFCEDLGPHKRYFFTMQEYPEDLVLTFDDDVIYNSDVIEKLYSSYLAHPECISGIRVHKITFSQSDRSIRKYTDWELECIGCEGDESHKYLITSVAGDIYPPHSVHEEAFNVEALKNLCPMNDDIWLKVMEVM